MGIQERRERERERRRQQIMVAAKTVFSQKGFAKATMEDIARAAELSPGTLYLYFKNKDELNASLSLRILQYLMIRLEDVKNNADNSPGKRIQSLRNAIYDVYEFDPLMFVKMFHLQSSESFQNLTPELRETFQSLTEAAFGAMAEIITPCLPAGASAVAPPETLAEIIWASFAGIVIHTENKKASGIAETDLRAVSQTAFDIFFQGVIK